ncbi:unnamed protein product [Chilo suppressalis]|uniref:C2H2-type domain-containing protein n=1 Tax=Chilo suppressalis TaxID=168631 RepID=A0ABN8BB02_CHISP|nr:unnamed protein product [Chilo suppressalis]
MKKATMLSYFTQDSDVAPAYSSDKESIVGVARIESTAVKRMLSDTHGKRSDTTDDEVMDNLDILFSEPHTTTIISDITKNLPNKPAQETLRNKVVTMKKATMLSYFTQDSDVVLAYSYDKESIVGVARIESTAVKRMLSDTHGKRSDTTDEEVMDNLDILSSEPHTTTIVSDITKNVPNKPAQETFRINGLTEANDIGIVKDDVDEEINKLRKELKEDEKCLKIKRDSAKRAKKILAKEKLEKSEQSCSTVRSSTYLHLLLRVSNTQEGRKRVRTVPLKLPRPQTETDTSLQSDLRNRICATCGIYFTSQKSVQTHSRYVHGKTTQNPRESRVRSQRLAARRANELLYIVRHSEALSEDADWLDVDEVDASCLTIPETSSSALRIPVMKESEWLANP